MFNPAKFAVAALFVVTAVCSLGHLLGARIMFHTDFGTKWIYAFGGDNQLRYEFVKRSLFTFESLMPFLLGLSAMLLACLFASKRLGAN